jgi:hypothetical protein
VLGALAGIVGLALCSCARNGLHPSTTGAGTPSMVAGAIPTPGELDREISLRVDDIEVQRGSVGHLMPMDSPQNDVDTFVFSGASRSVKAIASFTATLILQDQHGNTLYSGAVQSPQAVPPAGTFAVRITAGNDTAAVPNPELVRGVSPTDARLRYQVQTITYADGTSATRR